jgi:hypothetical protein
LATPLQSLFLDAAIQDSSDETQGMADMDDTRQNWQARVIIQSQDSHSPCLNSATFNFDLGPFASEDGARECWKSLGFLLPEKAKVFFDVVDGSGSRANAPSQSKPDGARSTSPMDSKTGVIASKG